MQCLQLVPESISAKENMPYEMSLSAALESHLYFFVMVLMRMKVGKNKLNTNQNEVISTLVQKVWNVLTEYPDGIVSLKPQDTHFKTALPLLRLDGMDAMAWDQSSKLDNAIWFLCYSTPESISELISNNSRYLMLDESQSWTDLDSRDDVYLWCMLLLRSPVLRV